MLDLFKKKDKDFMSYKVLTSNGSVPIERIKPGDMLYKYPSGELLPVREVVKTEMGNVCHIIYNDKRVQNILDNSMIYAGNNIIPSIMKFPNMLHDTMLEMFSSFPYQSIEFNNWDGKGLRPDPYTAGVLITYGDWREKYVNVPKFVGDDKEILYGSIQSSPTRFDSFINFLYDDRKNRIKWKSLFKEDDFYKKKKINSGKHLIPERYKMARKDDRIEFIRGALTGGMLWDLSDVEISIANKSDDILKELRNIFLSLGIATSLSYRASDDKFFGYPFRLTILPGEDGRYSEILYSMKKINEAECLHKNPMIAPAKIGVSLIKPTRKQCYTLNVEFYQANQPFYADDLLPRISV